MNENRGKGNVIRRMFREIDARCYIMIDGDDTYPLEYAREMADKVLLEGSGYGGWRQIVPLLIIKRTSAHFITWEMVW